MTETKVRSLVVRPRHAAELAFSRSGILEQVNVVVGDDVAKNRVFRDAGDWRGIRDADMTVHSAIERLKLRSLANLRLNQASSTARLAQARIEDSLDGSASYLVALDMLRERFLTSAMPGVVSAVMKAPGEYVAAGEPVVRVESAHRIQLVGQIQHRGRIGVGWRGTLRTRRLFHVALQAHWPVRVISVRGHGPDDDEWDVILVVDGSNTTRSWTPAPSMLPNKGLPLNYHFGAETELTLSP